MPKLAQKCGECNFAPYLAEFVATLMFVFVGAGAVIGGIDGPFAAAAHGITILMLVAAIGNISGGHMNTAVTLAMMFRGTFKEDFSFCRGLGYILAQVAGAVAGAGMLYGLALLTDGGKAAGDAVNFGTPALADGLNPLGGVIYEITFAFILVFVILRTAVEEKLTWAPLAIGGAVFVGALTGNSFNPARWFGPAVISGTWENAWIYILCPMVGGMIAVVVNDIVSKNKNSSRA